MATWKDLEGNVRRSAAAIWGREFRSSLIHGRQIDAYASLSDKHHIAIEVTEKKDINKIQEDLNKLVHVRNVNFSSGFINTECICVTSYEPTLAMRSAGNQINIEVLGIDDFQARFLPFDNYNEVRSKVPFGSAIDPATGNKDTKQYVVVSLVSESGSELDAASVSQLVSSGKVVVLTGEYGTGKSKCAEHVYSTLASVAWDTLKFPMAIDLRKCWGLKDRYEIIQRHVKDLGMHDAVDAFVKAYANGMLVLLLDGFDELGVQKRP